MKNKHYIFPIAATAIFVVTICATGILISNSHKSNRSNTQNEMESESESSIPAMADKDSLSETEYASDFFLSEESSEWSVSETEDFASMSSIKNVSLLNAPIQNLLEQYEGTWSVYVQQLGSEAFLSINDDPMPSASVMKLFIMGAVYEKISQGYYSEDDVYDLLYDMITISDNESANELLSILGNGDYFAGIEQVNNFCKDRGYDNGTVEYNGFDNPETYSGKSINSVTAVDCAHILTDIYNGDCVTKEASEHMLNMLLDQDTDYKIVSGLPENTKVANKSGETSNTENDVGIIFSPGGNYILCILSNSWPEEEDGNVIYHFTEISQLVYDFFNSQEED